MSTAGALAGPAVLDPWRLLRPAVPALGIGLVAWALLFQDEILQAVRVWNASTAYGHCWFVLPIAVYLAWDRRAAARGRLLRPALWPALLAVPGVVAWLVAERIGIMEGRQLAAIGFVELLFLGVLGWRLAWAFSAGLLYLVFLVPFGAFLTPALQRFTAWFTDAGLGLLGITHYTENLTVDIPEGTFYIAEACAGLRFLIAAIAFAVLYACLIYRSTGRRVAFIAAACVVPVIANGIRALGIVVAGHLLGSAEAVEADHVLYGWVFFSMVILLLVLAGLPFRQDHAPAPATGAAARPRPVAPAAPWFAAPWFAAATVLGVAAIGPAVAAVLEVRNGPLPRAVALPSFVSGTDCVAGEAPSPGVQRFTCGGFVLTATVRVFPPRANPGVLLAARRSAAAEDRAEDTVEGALPGAPVMPPGWRLAETRRPDRSTATALWIDGAPVPDGVSGRLRQARNSVFGTDRAPVLMAVGIAADGPMDARQRQAARQVIRVFLDAQGDLRARAVALARAAAAAP